MKIFSRTQNTTKRKKTKQKIYVRMQVLHELMSLLNFCKAKKKDTPTAEFFSEVSKRQRNPIENFKTQSVRGGRSLYFFANTSLFYFLKCG